MGSPFKHKDAGVATVENTVVVAPVVFFVLMLFIQSALYGWAYLSAQSAATIGFQTARTVNGSSATGSAAATNFLQENAAASFTAPHVHVTKNATTVTVTVRGSAETLVPSLTLPISVTVAGPVERITTP